MPHDDDQLVCAFTTTSSIEADMLKNQFESEGIPCVLDNAHQAGLAGILEIRGMVVSSHEVQARLLLAKIQQQRQVVEPAESADESAFHHHQHLKHGATQQEEQQ
jgi:hypothetical protein